MWSPGQGATDAARSPSIITTRFPQTYGLRATASASERGCMRSLRPAVSGARTPLSYSGDCDGYEDRGMTQRSGRVDHSMTTQTIPRTDIRRALLWGGLLAILWVAVAIIRSGTTFHLAPFLVAAAPPVLFTMDDGFTADPRYGPEVGGETVVHGEQNGRRGGNEERCEVECRAGPDDRDSHPENREKATPQEGAADVGTGNRLRCHAVVNPSRPLSHPAIFVSIAVTRIGERCSCTADGGAQRSHAPTLTSGCRCPKTVRLGKPGGDDRRRPGRICRTLTWTPHDLPIRLRR